MTKAEWSLLMENTLNTSSEDTNKETKWNLFLDKDDTKETVWVGWVDVNLLTQQRDELTVVNRDLNSDELEGIVNFLDAIIDARLKLDN
jgi:hypothetical protein